LGHHLILGGSGFLGRHVAALLVQRGIRVVLTGRRPLSSEFVDRFGGRLTYHVVDTRSANWPLLLDGASVIHHYAWGSTPAVADRDPVDDLNANVESTVQMLEALRRGGDRLNGKPTVVFSSSGGTVYGRLRHIPAHEDHPLSPTNTYGAGKAAVELYLGAYRALHKIDCRIARIANPYGAGQDLSKGQGAVTTFLHRALQGLPIAIWGDGEVVRDFIHISDAASGLVALACAPDQEGPWIFNIGSGQGVSLNGIVAELELQLGRRIHVCREPGRSFDIPVNVLDITLAQEVLGWAPRLSFPVGIARTLADLARNADLSSMD
jgi:UDP-glucose 4-epimerase